MNQLRSIIIMSIMSFGCQTKTEKKSEDTVDNSQTSELIKNLEIGKNDNISSRLYEGKALDQGFTHGLIVKYKVKITKKATYRARFNAITGCSTKGQNVSVKQFYENMATKVKSNDKSMTYPDQLEVGEYIFTIAFQSNSGDCSVQGDYILEESAYTTGNTTNTTNTTKSTNNTAGRAKLTNGTIQHFSISKEKSSLEAKNSYYYIEIQQPENIRMNIHTNQICEKSTNDSRTVNFKLTNSENGKTIEKSFEKLQNFADFEELPAGKYALDIALKFDANDCEATGIQTALKYESSTKYASSAPFIDYEAVPINISTTWRSLDKYGYDTKENSYTFDADGKLDIQTKENGFETFRATSQLSKVIRDTSTDDKGSFSLTMKAIYVDIFNFSPDRLEQECNYSKTENALQNYLRLDCKSVKTGKIETIYLSIPKS